jgi:hypothetical protein
MSATVSSGPCFLHSQLFLDINKNIPLGSCMVSEIWTFGKTPYE